MRDDKKRRGVPNMKDEREISVILPTYNEIYNIVDLIETLCMLMDKKEIKAEIVVVDDNSPDGTGRLVAERYNNNSQVKCIIRENERGLATAIKTGILNSKGDVIVIMDTDFNHDPFKLPEMIAINDHYDIVSGSRYVWGGGMLGSRFRYWGSYFFNLFIRAILGLETRDNFSGFVVFKRQILDKFDMDYVFRGYGEYYIRFLWYAKKLNLKVIEVPVMYKLRQGGESKTNFLRCLFVYALTALQLKLREVKGE